MKGWCHDLLPVVVVVVLFLLLASLVHRRAAADAEEGERRKEEDDVFRVASYNLWNTMWHWPIRQLYVAQLIQELSPDVIAFQEVLQYDGSELTQLHELRSLLPSAAGYAWLQYFPTPTRTAYHHREGVGVLSRHPVEAATLFNLSHVASSADTNRRVLGHVRIRRPSTGGRGGGDSDSFVDIYVTHMSYDKNVQYSHAIEIQQRIASSCHRLPDGTCSAVLLGDMNVYNEYDVPIRIFQLDYSSIESSKQQQQLLALSHVNVIQFVDAWEFLQYPNQGLTFSNMPTPGMVSRPDRVLVSAARLVPRSMQLLGNGTDYNDRYYWTILWRRFRTMVANSEECVFDCGPRAKCVCGVCVADASPCPVPCPECNQLYGKMKAWVVRSAAVWAVAALLGRLAFGRYWLILAYIVHRASSFRSLRCLTAKSTHVSWKRFSSEVSPLRSLLWCLLGAVLSFVACLAVVFLQFVSVDVKTEWKILFDHLPEEFFPSDHLMLTVDLHPQISQHRFQ